MLRSSTPTRRAPWLLQRAQAPAPIPGLGAQTRRAFLSLPRPRPRPRSTARPWTKPSDGPAGRARPRRQQQQTTRTFRSSARRQAGGDGSPSFGARMKKMSREYGAAAIWVYLGLSVLDFPFCFMLVKVVGTEKIGQLEQMAASFIPQPVKDAWHGTKAMFRRNEEKATGHEGISERVEMATWGVREAEEANEAHASLGTQLALAYAIHKSFIFVRIPVTAAVLPKVVKVLRGWGLNIGRKKG